MAKSDIQRVAKSDIERVAKSDREWQKNGLFLGGGWIGGTSFNSSGEGKARKNTLGEALGKAL